jgi:hypothetical protein
VDPDAVRGLARTAEGFAARHVAPVIDSEGRDGDLTLVPSVLDAAGEIGVWVPCMGARYAHFDLRLITNMSIMRIPGTVFPYSGIARREAT